MGQEAGPGHDWPPPGSGRWVLTTVGRDSDRERSYHVSAHYYATGPYIAPIVSGRGATPEEAVANVIGKLQGAWGGRYKDTPLPEAEVILTPGVN